MLPVRFAPPAARYIKKLKDKRLKELYKEAVDAICTDYTKCGMAESMTVYAEGKVTVWFKGGAEVSVA